jgi:hypothetical protein
MLAVPMTHAIDRLWKYRPYASSWFLDGVRIALANTFQCMFKG